MSATFWSEESLLRASSTSAAWKPSFNSLLRIPATANARAKTSLVSLTQAMGFSYFIGNDVGSGLTAKEIVHSLLYAFKSSGFKSYSASDDCLVKEVILLGA